MDYFRIDKIRFWTNWEWTKSTLDQSKIGLIVLWGNCDWDLSLAVFIIQKTNYYLEGLQVMLAVKKYPWFLTEKRCLFFRFEGIFPSLIWPELVKLSFWNLYVQNDFLFGHLTPHRCTFWVFVKFVVRISVPIVLITVVPIGPISQVF